MRKIIIGQNLNSGVAVLGFLLGFAALLLALTGPAHARQHVEFGGSCNGTSECVGNLSCHLGSLQWNLELEKTCECPEPGDGSYSERTNPENNDRRPVCYGRGLPCERHWDPEHGAFADCLPHERSEFGQFDSLIIGLPENGPYPLRASYDRSSRAIGTVNRRDRIWVVWCDSRGGEMWCNIELNGLNGWIEMRYVAHTEVHRMYESRR